MANPTLKHILNVPGSFYVDETCTDCDLCRSAAPEIFTRDDATGCSFVYRQPRSPEETALAEEVLGSCPTESIGNDGDPNPTSTSAQPADTSTPR